MNVYIISWMLCLDMNEILYLTIKQYFDISWILEYKHYSCLFRQYTYTELSSVANEILWFDWLIKHIYSTGVDWLTNFCFFIYFHFLIGP